MNTFIFHIERKEEVVGGIFFDNFTKMDLNKTIDMLV